MFKNLRFALAPALIVYLLAPSFAAAAIVNPNILFGLFKINHLNRYYGYCSRIFIADLCRCLGN